MVSYISMVLCLFSVKTLYQISFTYKNHYLLDPLPTAHCRRYLVAFPRNVNDSTLCALPMGCGLFNKPVVAAFLICLHTMNLNTPTACVSFFLFVFL